METRLLYLPSNILSLLAGIFARIRWPLPISRLLIRLYSALYQIDRSQCRLELKDFRTLSDFFARELKPECRAIEGGVICPVDGVLRDFGPIREGILCHVKGRGYGISELLQDSARAGEFSSGFYFNFYLSPADCHHVFSPVKGIVTGSSYVPGALFPVNEIGLRAVPRLFCVNERLISWIDSEYGKVALVMIGAMCVGQMQVSYDNWRTNPVNGLLSGNLAVHRAYSTPLELQTGDRLGTFFLGSSVVLLFENSSLRANDTLSPGIKVRYGRALAMP